MDKKVSVVTPERFKQGLSYTGFLDQAKVNKDRFAQSYQTARAALAPENARFFKEAREKGVARVLVLGEDWCPDVYRGMPVIARIAEASGMELRVFPRDANLDIMNEFLNHGQHQSIPTVVFYTSDQEYLCHWIERPRQAQDEMAQINEEIEREMAGKDANEIRQARRDRTNARFQAWQEATVKEIRDMLSSKLEA